MQSYEKLGAFYIGRRWDATQDRLTDEPILYDAKDLTTHAVCVGMTGSGKTGLCLTLLEEAAIDAVPAIAIDPKGDIGNLLFTFPGLSAQEFRPWVDEAEAARQGITPDELAARTAEQWRNGLAEWGQDGERIARLRASADMTIYTPGSTAGRPIAALRRLEAPAPALLADEDGVRERVLGTVSGLLSLLGIDVDPVRGREGILLARVIEDAWRAGRGIELPELIHAIQKPPFDRVGVLDLESFYPAAQRFELAMALNNLVASPGFAPWVEGEPLDVGRLFWTAEGRPRVSIFSIAHLGDAERMFFVTLLLNEVVAWMRTQAGSGSLRALLYMDEVFGFFPPVANPPSKVPMLTLLKQARAFGLGVVLATQNPVDLDYKGLANAGTWFLGRMQTERDKNRVLDGLESIGTGLDRAELDSMLSGLEKRVFFLHNVHETEPALFQTRWAMSYLRGPLTRPEIRRLTGAASTSAPPPGDARSATPAATSAGATFAAPPAASAAAQSRGTTSASRAASPSAVARETKAASAERPLLPPGVVERFLPVAGSAAGTLLQPALLGRARMHFVDAKLGVDHWEDATLVVRLPQDGVPANVWAEADPVGGSTSLAEQAPRDASFTTIPAEATRAASYTSWRKALGEHLYRQRRLTVWRAPALDASSRPGETEADFRIRVTQLARERRDAEVDKLRQRYATRLEKLHGQLGRAQERVSREQSQLQQQKFQTVVSVGSTLLGALMGRKVTSTRNLGSAASSMRGVGRMGREKEDVQRAAGGVEAVREDIAELEAELGSETEKMAASYDPGAIALEPRELSPRKGDLAVEPPVLLWVPAL